jgi:hypothetical protein
MTSPLILSLTMGDLRLGQRPDVGWARGAARQRRWPLAGPDDHMPGRYRFSLGPAIALGPDAHGRVVTRPARQVRWSEKSPPGRQVYGCAMVASTGRYGASSSVTGARARAVCGERRRWTPRSGPVVPASLPQRPAAPIRIRPRLRWTRRAIRDDGPRSASTDQHRPGTVRASGCCCGPDPAGQRPTADRPDIRSQPSGSRFRSTRCG